MAFSITEHTLKTARHTTGYLACGAQAAALGFRCIAPDILEAYTAALTKWLAAKLTDYWKA